MKIQEQTFINRTPAEVWPWIAVPERFMQWNDNIVSMESRERFVLHQPFNSHYQLRDKPLQCISTVTAIEENRLLELRHDHCIGPGVRSDMEVVERIALEDRGEQTVVVKTLTVKNHNIPLIFLPLIWLVSRFGKLVKPNRLKYLCEGLEIPSDVDEASLAVHEQELKHTPKSRIGYRITVKKAQPFSLSGIQLPLSVIISFGWMLANIINPAGAAIVLFHAQGYRQAVFTVEKLHREERRRTGLQWGFSGTIDGVKERFYARDIALDSSTRYLGLKKRGSLPARSWMFSITPTLPGNSSRAALSGCCLTISTLSMRNNAE